MPDKDGIETAKELMQTHPQGVVMGDSGAATATDYFQFLARYGVRRCFRKPLPLQDLEAAINEELSLQVTSSSHS